MRSAKSVGRAMPKAPKTRQRGSKRKVFRAKAGKPRVRAKLTLKGKPDDDLTPDVRAKLWAEFTQTDTARLLYRENGLKIQVAFKKWLTHREVVPQHQETE